MVASRVTVAFTAVPERSAPFDVDMYNAPTGIRSGKKENGIVDSSKVHVTVTVAFTATVAGAVMVAVYGLSGMETTVLGGLSVTGTAAGVTPRSNAMPLSAAELRAGSAEVLVRTR